MRYRPPARIIGKNKEHGLVLLGGLGHLGMGQMWVKEDPRHEQREGYADAPNLPVAQEDAEWALSLA